MRRRAGSSTVWWLAAAVLLGDSPGSAASSHPEPRTLFSIVDPGTDEPYAAHERRPQHEEWSERLREFWEVAETGDSIDETTPWQATTAVARSLRSSAMPSTSTPCSLGLDKTSITQHGESLTVSWGPPHRSTEEGTPDHEPAFLGTDLLAVHCGGTGSSPFPPHDGVAPHRFLEAATLSELGATSRLHRSAEPGLFHGTREGSTPPTSCSDCWYIPRFPTSIREPRCQFLLYRIDDESHQERTSTSGVRLLARSPVLTIETTNVPTNLHLALTQDPSEVLIQFTTAGDAGATPVAMYGRSMPPSEQKVEGTSLTYAAEDMCSAPANLTDGTNGFCNPGQLHTIPMSNLQPSTIYHYKVGLALGQGIVWSDDVYSFLSPPPVGPPPPPEEPPSPPSASSSSSAILASLEEEQSNIEDKKDNDPWYTYLVYGDQGCPSVGWGMGGAWTALAAAREIQLHAGGNAALQSAATETATSRTNRTISDPASSTFARALASGNASEPLLLRHHVRHHHHHHKKKKRTPDAVGKNTIQAVHHVGDLSYARGAAHIWDEWFSLIQVFAARVPLMVAVGNHEYDHFHGGQNKDPSGYNHTHGYMPKWGNYGDDSGGECGVPVAKRFQMPKTGNGVFWYSYDSSVLHTIVLSSEHDLSPGQLQYNWLVNDLRAVNRTLTPWVVVELHRPLYMNQEIWPDNNVGLGLRRSLEPVLRRYKVDLVFSGHYHTYFRSCAGLHESQCHNGGPTHITVGSAGAFLEVTNLYDTHWAARNLQGVYGYGRVSIHNTTALHFEFVRAGPEDDNTTGKVLDAVWIHK